jgi:predicted AlkP superfamily pyrophosphatase or phosphodiesterase
VNRSHEVSVGAVRRIGAGRFERGAGDSRALRDSPELDRATLAIATSVRRELALGEGPSTDLLAIGLSATDYVGHAFGTQGSEMCLQILALDKMLGAFLEDLDSTSINYFVVVTGDHGAMDAPERARQQSVPDAARLD